MRVHFIAIGGSAMHNMAIALHLKGYEVTGSDDEIFEPSKSRLDAHGLLPMRVGWNPDAIDASIDAIILGMHARKDNPELIKAQSLGLKIYSYPEYIYEQSKEKVRVVIAGSHGKTTITSMVLHVLNYYNRDFDYMVGAQLDGFETMVKLTHDAPIIILEGDEYLSSPIDLRPKFFWYQPHIALVSGIAWDHINVFPTFESYLDQFKQFIQSTIEREGKLIYCGTDTHLRRLLAELDGNKTHSIEYGTPEHAIRDGVTYLKREEGEVGIEVFGQHNLQNLQGAKHILNELNISDDQFYEAIQSFKGASKRLQKVAESERSVVYKDFAHSPSKLKATTSAVKVQFPDRRLVAVMELHTFSSLNADFLKEYRGAMDAADTAMVYFNPEVVKHKKLPEITVEQVREAFGNESLMVRTDTESLVNYLKGIEWHDTNLLLMTSGNFGGVEIDSFAKELLGE